MNGELNYEWEWRDVEKVREVKAGEMGGTVRGIDRGIEWEVRVGRGKRSGRGRHKFGIMLVRKPIPYIDVTQLGTSTLYLNYHSHNLIPFTHLNPDSISNP